MLQKTRYTEQVLRGQRPALTRSTFLWVHQLQEELQESKAEEQTGSGFFFFDVLTSMSGDFKCKHIFLK